jgi:hypothetical protein
VVADAEGTLFPLLVLLNARVAWGWLWLWRSARGGWSETLANLQSAADCTMRAPILTGLDWILYVHLAHPPLQLSPMKLIAMGYAALSARRALSPTAPKWFWMAVSVLIVCTWTVVGFVLVLPIMVVPGLALTVPAPLAALTLGCLGGLLVASRRNCTTRRVAVTGLSVGAGALLANVVAFGLIGDVLGSLVAIQDMLGSALPAAGGVTSSGSLAPLGAAAGGFAGFVSGMVDLILALVGALLGGLLAEHPPAQHGVRLVSLSETQPSPERDTADYSHPASRSA